MTTPAPTAGSGLRVEGNDDLHSIRCLLRRRGITPKPIEVRDGYPKLLAGMEQELKRQDA